MRRVFTATVTTLVGLVMLLSFKTTHGQLVTDLSGPGAAGPGTTPKATAHATAPAKKKPKKKVVLRLRNVTGDTVYTQWGPVQVRITVRGRTIVDVHAVQLPYANGTDQSIAAYAAPILRREALSAQSAHIQMVSGASYTSYGYIHSLQSAIDKARRA